MSRRLRRLPGDRRAISTVEFALIFPVLALMLMGFFDLGYQAYVRAVLQGAMQQAGRNATLETGASSATAIDNYVKDQVRRVAKNAVFSPAPTRLSYSDFASVGKPEKFVDKTPFNNKYDVGECFEDVNGNGTWDSDLGKSGQGGADDAVLYTVTVQYKRTFPMSKLFGWSTDQVVKASTVLRNQPFGDQALPVYAKCT
jgi:Flp pilus assembly protein TadG